LFTRGCCPFEVISDVNCLSGFLTKVTLHTHYTTATLIQLWLRHMATVYDNNHVSAILISCVLF